MMKPTTSVPAIRTLTKSALARTARPVFARSFAAPTGLGTTATPKAKRRSVTPFNDTGFVPWSELSGAEKAARATQQSYNFGMVIVGLVCTVRLKVVDWISMWLQG
jgi:import inner membrane translocase subunit TIM21